MALFFNGYFAGYESACSYSDPDVILCNGGLILSLLVMTRRLSGLHVYGHHRRKKARPDGRASSLSESAVYAGPLLRNVQIRSRPVCPSPESAHRQTTDKNKRPCLPTGPFVLFDAWQFPTLAWGDPTLPSALRRFTSEFGMGSGGTTALLPPGKFFVLCTPYFIASAALAALVKSVTYFSMLLPFLRLPPCCCANYCVLQSGILAENSLKSPKQLRRCKVKPHGSLVPVSSTHRCAYTPGLSTSSSLTFLQDPLRVRENSSRGKFRA